MTNVSPPLISRAWQEAWRQHRVSAAALQRSLLYHPGAAQAVAHFAPLTVLISGQLQVPAWRLPVSVPFANFSSQDRHKTQGTPAAVHPNPVLSMSLSNTRGDDQPRSGFGLVPPYRKHSHMVQGNQRLWLLCFWSTCGLFFFFFFPSGKL